MATIQIREIPDDAYEVMRRRARVSGKSLQKYMRDVVVELASGPTVDEALAQMATIRRGTAEVTRESILAGLDADRR